MLSDGASTDHSAEVRRIGKRECPLLDLWAGLEDNQRQASVRLRNLRKPRADQVGSQACGGGDPPSAQNPGLAGLYDPAPPANWRPECSSAAATLGRWCHLPAGTTSWDATRARLGRCGRSRRQALGARFCSHAGGESGARLLTRPKGLALANLQTARRPSLSGTRLSSEISTSTARAVWPG